MSPRRQASGTAGRRYTTSRCCATFPRRSRAMGDTSTRSLLTSTPHYWRGCSRPSRSSPNRSHTRCGRSSPLRRWSSPGTSPLLTTAWRRSRCCSSSSACGPSCSPSSSVSRSSWSSLCWPPRGGSPRTSNRSPPGRRWRSRPSSSPRPSCFCPSSSWSAAATAAATPLNLGSAGLTSWWHALRDGQASATHLEYTLAHVFGLGPFTYALWAVQGAAAVYVAWARRLETEIVFAAGILGSATVAFHFHHADYSCLVLGAWLVLRTSPPLWHRLWMLPGILAMQAMIYLVVAPQLIWDASWLAILVASTFAQARAASRTAWPIPVRP